MGRLGAWKLYSRLAGGVSTDAGGNGVLGTLKAGGNEGEWDGGGNSSPKIRGAGRRWAWAGGKGAIAPLPTKIKGTQDTLPIRSIQYLNGFKNLAIIVSSDEL